MISRIALSLSLFLIVINGFSSGILHTNVYNLASGLSNTVYTTHQSADGYIWIGASNGLFRFNGKDFEILISDQEIRSIYEDEQGRIWAGGSKGLSWLSKGEVFKIEDTLNFKGSTVLDIEGSDNQIWAATNDGGLNHISMMNDSLIIKNYDKSFSLPSNFIYDIQKQNDGEYLLGMVGGLMRMTIADSVSFKHLHGSLNTSFILSISQLSGKVILGSYEDGLLELDIEEYTLNQLQSGRVWSTYYHEDDNELFFSIDHDGLWSRINGQIQKLDLGQELNQSTILHIQKSEDGSFWLCSSEHGLIHLYPKAFTLIPDNSAFGEINFLEKNDSETYLFCNDKGIGKISLMDSNLELILFKELEGITAFHKSKERIYLGFSDGKLKVLNFNLEILEDLELTNLGFLNSIYESENGLWVGGSYGLSFLQNSIEVFKLDDSKGLIHDEVQDIKSLDGNTIWVATLGGLARIQGDQYRDYNEEDGLKDLSLSKIYFSESGGMYLLASNTLYELEEQEGEINVNKSFDLSSTYLKDIKEFTEINKDYFGLWSEKGVELIQRIDTLWKSHNVFSLKNGFHNSIINIGSIYSEGKNGLVHGSNGFIKYSLNDNPSSITKPKLLIKEISLFNKKQSWSSLFETDPYGIPLNLDLSYDQNFLNFEIDLINYSGVNQIEFLYSIDADGAYWNKTIDNHLDFNNLNSGTYNLRIKAKAGDIIESEVLEYTFTIRPPFWKTWWFYLIIALIIGLGVYAYFYLKLRNLKAIQKTLEIKVEERTREINEQSKVILEQRDTLFEQKKEIVDSISYAQRIQLAVMPEKDLLSRYFKNSFILFRPKDIVSGDFFWFSEVDDKIVFTVADCTGHGVPGAFMSMLGIRFLNEIVLEQKLIEPAEILNTLRDKVIQSLNKEGKDVDYQDGMDITLCTYHSKSKKLKVAAAFNSLVIVSDNELKEIKADRMPVAKYLKMNPFKQEEIELHEGDRIFLYSDGFPDQIGGENGKKYKSKTFKKLILDSSDKSILEQAKVIETELENWKKAWDQTDDIALMGIEIV